VSHQTDGLKTVASFADHSNLQVAFEEISNSGAEVVVIVDNQYSDHGSSGP
jgi:hypothetical protein